MRHEEILEQAITRAINGGWAGFKYYAGTHSIEHTTQYKVRESDQDDWQAVVLAGNRIISPPEFIYDHEFARALWGDEPHRQHFGMSCNVTQPTYAFHLQQMVIADDPIAYLGAHL